VALTILQLLGAYRNRVSLIADKFKSSTIGANNGNNVNVLNPVIFQDPITIRAANGSITVAGVITGIDDASITLMVPQL
jgi:hypothetical protein